LGPQTKLLHLDNASWEVEKIYPTEVGLFADPKAGLEELAEALDQDLTASGREAAATRMATLTEGRRRADEAYRQSLQANWDHRPMAVDRMMHEISQALPENAIIADEAVTSRSALMRAMDFDQPGSFYSIRGGALGWAMPGALGVKLANPDRPVVAVVGDGASMYTVQALWTAARYNIPVTYAICNNRSYRILKVNMEIYLRRMLEDRERSSEYVGMDFATPLPLAEIAQAMGVTSEKIEDPANLGPAIERAIASGKPSLVDVSIDGSL
jgi:benzoylformate decarboxylase